MCAFLFGIGLGGDYMIIPLMAAEMYGVAIMGRVMGVVLTADSVSEALVPMIVAGLRDQTGSYTTGFLLLLALAAVGAIAVSLLPGSPEVCISGATDRTEKGLTSPLRCSRGGTDDCLPLPAHWGQILFFAGLSSFGDVSEREHTCKKQDLTPTVEPPD